MGCQNDKEETSNMLMVKRKLKEKKCPPSPDVPSEWVLRSPLHLGDRDRNINNNGTGGGKHKQYKRLNSEEAKPTSSTPSLLKKSKKKNSLDSAELFKQASFETLNCNSGEAASGSQTPSSFVDHVEETIKLPAEYILTDSEHLLQKRRTSGHRISYRKAIQKAGFMNELVTNSLGGASPVLNHKCSQKSEVDWTENALCDDHLWAPSNASGDLCYVGETACTKSGPRKKCSACHIVVHDSCYEQLVKIGFRCKTTCREATTRNAREAMIVHHHWVHRRKQEGKCKHCGKEFEKRFRFREQTKVISISCSWCKEAYHNKVGCFHITKINEPCTLGFFAKSVVPPTWIIKSSQKQKSVTKRSKKKRGSGSTFRKKSSSRDRPRTFVVRPLAHQASFVTPILVFINPKSGGNQGAKLLQSFQWAMNPRQVFDLSKGGPQEGLELYRKVTNLRILACGGDGTAGWILSVIDKLSMTRPPPLAILPLGTGNDLSRTLNFGPGYTDEPISKIIQGVLEGKPAKLDRWKMYVEKNEQAQRLVDEDEASAVEDTHGACVDKPPLDVVNNYFSIGSDAQVSLAFHESREAHPGKFNSRIGNKFYYARAGVSEYLTRQSKKLSKHIEVECDGQNLTHKIREIKPVCILFLNIPRYSSGTSPWGNPSGGEFSAQRHDDKLIEVLAFTANQLGMLFVGGHGERLCQCRSARITTYKAFPMQVDGEPCRLNPSIIRFEFLNQANVVYKTKKADIYRELSNPPEQIKIRFNVVTSQMFELHAGERNKIKTCATPFLVTVAMNNSTLATLRSCFDELNSGEKTSEQLSERWFFLDPAYSGKFYRIDRNQEHLHQVASVINDDGELFIMECPPVDAATGFGSKFPRSPNVDKAIVHRRRVQSDIAGPTDPPDFSAPILARSADVRRDNISETDGADAQRHSPAAQLVDESSLDVVFEQDALEENEEGKGLFTGTADSFLAAASASATEPKAPDAENAANVACEASDRGETETESAPAVNKSPSPSVSRPTVEVSVTAPASSDPLPKGASDDVCAEEEDPPSTVASSALSTLTRTVSASSGTSPFLRPSICESDASTHSTSSNEYVFLDDAITDPPVRKTRQSSLVTQKSPQKSPLRNVRSIPAVIGGPLASGDFSEKLIPDNGKTKIKKKKKQHKRSNTDTNPKKTMEGHGGVLLSNFVKSLKSSGNDNNNSNAEAPLLDRHPVANGCPRRRSCEEGCWLNACVGSGSDLRSGETASSGNEEVLSSVEEPSTLWNDAFLDASERGDLPAMKDAVNRGADVRAVDADGRTALHIASQIAHVCVVDYLLQESPQLVETLDKNNQSPLHRAAWLGRRQVCERLLEAGAVIGRTDSKNKNAIDRAKQSGNLSLVQFLTGVQRSRLQKVIPNLSETDL